MLTIVPPKPSREGETMLTELKENGIPVFNTMIRRSAGFQKAALEGVSIRDVSESRSRLPWQDYKSLGQEILEVLNDG